MTSHLASFGLEYEHVNEWLRKEKRNKFHGREEGNKLRDWSVLEWSTVDTDMTKEYDSEYSSNKRE